MDALPWCNLGFVVGLWIGQGSDAEGRGLLCEMQSGCIICRAGSRDPISLLRSTTITFAAKTNHPPSRRASRFKSRDFRTWHHRLQKKSGVS